LSDLQEALWIARTHSVLVVLQGVDTSGKDGTIRHVFSGLNPQGARVASFKAPTEIEAAHDFLWRVHAQCPARGELVVFNRSHYEDVLAARVRGLVPKAVWSRRYARIVEFEDGLASEGTIVVKFLLHVSKEEQLRRLRARESNPRKRWKVDPADWKERRSWDENRRAFEDVLERTSTRRAPWIVVPADRKWYRNLAVTDALVRRLEPHRRAWERAILARGRAAMGRTAR
jgi:PPK2 family polyphosphate:nucleotide phosphotransferase